RHGPEVTGPGGIVPIARNPLIWMGKPARTSQRAGLTDDRGRCPRTPPAPAPAGRPARQRTTPERRHATGGRGSGPAASEDGGEAGADGGEDPGQQGAEAEVDLGEVAHRLVAGAETRVERRQRPGAVRAGLELVAGGVAHRPQV